MVESGTAIDKMLANAISGERVHFMPEVYANLGEAVEHETLKTKNYLASVSIHQRSFGDSIVLGDHLLSAFRKRQWLRFTTNLLLFRE